MSSHWTNFLVIRYWRLSSQLPYARYACLGQTVYRLPCNKEPYCQETEMLIFFPPNQIIFHRCGKLIRQFYRIPYMFVAPNTSQYNCSHTPATSPPILVTKLSPNAYSICSLQQKGRVYHRHFQKSQMVTQAEAPTRLSFHFCFLIFR